MNRAGMSCPFVAGPKIKELNRFAGRREELKFLADRMSGSQPVSVNVVGERRIGKSSLLYHFWQTWAQRVAASARFAVFYTDLQQDDPASEDAFFQLLAKLLLTRSTLCQDSQVQAALSATPFTRQDFAAALEHLAGRSLLPVFCLDEFEMLLKRPEQFGDPFFDHLRGLMNANRLMFIFASREPVDVYAKEQKLTSGFFNLGQLLPLDKFSEAEADELVNLPDRNNPALNAKEQRLARKWGGRHPYLLQLAGQCLFEARQAGKDAAWAKRQFTAQRERLKKDGVLTKPRSFKALLESSLSALKQTAEAAEHCGKILLFLILAALLAGIIYGVWTGKLTWSAAGDWLLKLIGK